MFQNMITSELILVLCYNCTINVLNMDVSLEEVLRNKFPSSIGYL